MQITNQHKALLITFLISVTVLIFVFNLSLKKQNAFLSSSYYELVAQEKLEEEDKVLEELDNLNANLAETNTAFNETSSYKDFEQAYKPIPPPNDYLPKANNEVVNSFESYDRKYNPLEKAKVNKDEFSSFDKVNEVLKKQNEISENNKSTISYSLKNRKKIFIPIPIYLCEVSGKIVVNIFVDSKGSVKKAYLNTSSNSSNECLIEHAIAYAKQAQFNIDESNNSQLGSITFNFTGKH